MTFSPSQKNSAIGLVFIVLLLLGGLYFFSDTKDKNERVQILLPDENYGVVKTLGTSGPSPAMLVQSYFEKIKNVAAEVAAAKTCGDATTLGEKTLAEASVPKEFLQQHLDLFLRIKKMKQEQSPTCVPELYDQFLSLQETVTSTMRI